MMTCLFSKGVVNNYGQVGGRMGSNRTCMKYFGEPKRFQGSWVEVVKMF